MIVGKMTRGECLRMLRKQEGFSLRYVSKQTGISFGYLCNLENGEHRISLDHAHTLMEFYGGSLRIFAKLPSAKET